MSGELSLLIGTALDKAVGELVTCGRLPSLLANELEHRRQPELPDAWVILGRFESNHRTSGTWRGSGGLTLDLDWEDPTLPAKDGAHQPLPAEQRSQIAASLAEYTVPGLAYFTPRGLRLIHLLAEDVSDEDVFADLVDQASEGVLRHLGGFGVPLWRDGVVGLRLDRASCLPSQAMRLPLPSERTILFGQDCEVRETDLRASGVRRMNLGTALPADLGDASRQVADWVQIAVEVVVTGLMAIASAAIGNTRRVVARGFSVPLSLQYLTSLPSGSGKGTVRKYLRGATEGIQWMITARREEARREREAHEEELSVWRADGRSQNRRENRGPRPEPPPLTGRGRERVSFTVSEGNLEGVVATLEDTPRGFLWASDEAHEVLGMLGHYGDGRSARSLDAARLRRLMDGAPVEAHRARSNVSAVRRLPRPFLAMDADVQPGVLKSLFSGEDRVSGLTARLLMHAPPPRQGQRRYLDPPPEPGPEVLQLIRARLEALWEHPQELQQGEPVYEEVRLDDEAECLWATELERLERRYSGAGDEEVGALGHARGRLLCLAGVLALLRDPETRTVTGVDMRRAIEHIRYHLEHHRDLMSRGNEPARLERLRDQVMKIFKDQPEVGVRATDLRRHVAKERYAGDKGRQRAFADLHALGWRLRRRKRKGASGRRPVPSFFPPSDETASQTGGRGSSRKPQESSGGGLGGLGDGGLGKAAVRDLLDRASSILLAAGDVELPCPGRRVPCPACGSPDGLGTFRDDASRWYCHSDRHEDAQTGCAVDYLLAMQLERMPSVSEAVVEAKRIVGAEREAES